jgi:hypothetical protein
MAVNVKVKVNCPKQRENIYKHIWAGKTAYSAEGRVLSPTRRPTVQKDVFSRQQDAISLKSGYKKLHLTC